MQFQVPWEKPFTSMEEQEGDRPKRGEGEQQHILALPFPTSTPMPTYGAIFKKYHLHDNHQSNKKGKKLEGSGQDDEEDGSRRDKDRYILHRGIVLHVGDWLHTRQRTAVPTAKTCTESEPQGALKLDETEPSSSTLTSPKAVVHSTRGSREEGTLPRSASGEETVESGGELQPFTKKVVTIAEAEQNSPEPANSLSTQLENSGASSQASGTQQGSSDHPPSAHEKVVLTPVSASLPPRKSALQRSSSSPDAPCINEGETSVGLGMDAVIKSSGSNQLHGQVVILHHLFYANVHHHFSPKNHGGCGGGQQFLLTAENILQTYRKMKQRAAGEQEEKMGNKEKSTTSPHRSHRRKSSLVVPSTKRKSIVFLEKFSEGEDEHDEHKKDDNNNTVGTHTGILLAGNKKKQLLRRGKSLDSSTEVLTMQEEGNNVSSKKSYASSRQILHGKFDDKMMKKSTITRHALFGVDYYTVGSTASILSSASSTTINPAFAYGRRDSASTPRGDVFGAGFSTSDPSATEDSEKEMNEASMSTLRRERSRRRSLFFQEFIRGHEDDVCIRSPATSTIKGTGQKRPKLATLLTASASLKKVKAAQNKKLTLSNVTKIGMAASSYVLSVGKASSLKCLMTLECTPIWRTICEFLIDTTNPLLMKKIWQCNNSKTIRKEEEQPSSSSATKDYYTSAFRYYLKQRGEEGNGEVEGPIQLAGEENAELKLMKEKTPHDEEDEKTERVLGAHLTFMGCGGLSFQLPRVHANMLSRSLRDTVIQLHKEEGEEGVHHFNMEKDIEGRENKKCSSKDKFGNTPTPATVRSSGEGRMADGESERVMRVLKEFTEVGDINSVPVVDRHKNKNFKNDLDAPQKKEDSGRRKHEEEEKKISYPTLAMLLLKHAPCIGQLFPAESANGKKKKKKKSSGENEGEVVQRIQIGKLDVIVNFLSACEEEKTNGEADQISMGCCKDNNMLARIPLRELDSVIMETKPTSSLSNQGTGSRQAKLFLSAEGQMLQSQIPYGSDVVLVRIINQHSSACGRKKVQQPRVKYLVFLPTLISFYSGQNNQFGRHLPVQPLPHIQRNFVDQCIIALMNKGHNPAYDAITEGVQKYCQNRFLEGGGGGGLSPTSMGMHVRGSYSHTQLLPIQAPMSGGPSGAISPSDPPFLKSPEVGSITLPSASKTTKESEESSAAKTEQASPRLPLRKVGTGVFREGKRIAGGWKQKKDEPQSDHEDDEGGEEEIIVESIPAEPLSGESMNVFNLLMMSSAIGFNILSASVLQLHHFEEVALAILSSLTMPRAAGSMEEWLRQCLRATLFLSLNDDVTLSSSSTTFPEDFLPKVLRDTFCAAAIVPQHQETGEAEEQAPLWWMDVYIVTRFLLNVDKSTQCLEQMLHSGNMALTRAVMDCAPVESYPILLDIFLRYQLKRRKSVVVAATRPDNTLFSQSGVGGGQDATGPRFHVRYSFAEGEGCSAFVGGNAESEKETHSVAGGLAMSQSQYSSPHASQRRRSSCVQGLENLVSKMRERSSSIILSQFVESVVKRMMNNLLHATLVEPVGPSSSNVSAKGWKAFRSMSYDFGLSSTSTSPEALAAARRRSSINNRKASLIDATTTTITSEKKEVIDRIFHQMLPIFRDHGISFSDSVCSGGSIFQFWFNILRLATVALPAQPIRRVSHWLWEKDDILGWTPMHYAAAFADVSVVEKLTKVCDRSLGLVFDTAGQTPLHIATMESRSGICSELARWCPEALFCGPQCIYLSSFILSASSSSQRRASSVFEGSSHSFYVRTPLHLALQRPEGEVDVVLEHLLTLEFSKKAPPHLKMSTQLDLVKLIELCCAQGNASALEHILPLTRQQCCRWDEKQNNYESAASVSLYLQAKWRGLMAASLIGSPDCIMMLVEIDEEEMNIPSCAHWLNAMDKQGYTALAVAAKTNHSAAMGVLLEAGADINAPVDQPQFSPLIRCVIAHFNIGVTMLMDANCYIPTSAVFLASYLGFNDIPFKYKTLTALGGRKDARALPFWLCSDPLIFDGLCDPLTPAFAPIRLIASAAFWGNEEVYQKIAFACPEAKLTPHQVNAVLVLCLLTTDYKQKIVKKLLAVESAVVHRVTPLPVPKQNIALFKNLFLRFGITSTIDLCPVSAESDAVRRGNSMSLLRGDSDLHEKKQPGPISHISISISAYSSDLSLHQVVIPADFCGRLAAREGLWEHAMQLFHACPTDSILKNFVQLNGADDSCDYITTLCRKSGADHIVECFQKALHVAGNLAPWTYNKYISTAVHRNNMKIACCVCSSLSRPCFASLRTIRSPRFSTVQYRRMTNLCASLNFAAFSMAVPLQLSSQLTRAGSFRQRLAEQTMVSQWKNVVLQHLILHEAHLDLIMAFVEYSGVDASSAMAHAAVAARLDVLEAFIKKGAEVSRSSICASVLIRDAHEQTNLSEKIVKLFVERQLDVSATEDVDVVIFCTTPEYLEQCSQQQRTSSQPKKRHAPQKVSLAATTAAGGVVSLKIEKKTPNPLLLTSPNENSIFSGELSTSPMMLSPSDETKYQWTKNIAVGQSSGITSSATLQRAQQQFCTHLKRSKVSASYRVEGVSALCLAVLGGNIPAVRTLIQLGARFSNQTRARMLTPRRGSWFELNETLLVVNGCSVTAVHGLGHFSSCAVTQFDRNLCSRAFAVACSEASFLPPCLCSMLPEVQKGHGGGAAVRRKDHPTASAGGQGKSLLLSEVASSMEVTALKRAALQSILVLFENLIAKHWWPVIDAIIRTGSLYPLIDINSTNDAEKLTLSRQAFLCIVRWAPIFLVHFFLPLQPVNALGFCGIVSLRATGAAGTRIFNPKMCSGEVLVLWEELWSRLTEDLEKISTLQFLLRRSWVSVELFLAQIPEAKMIALTDVSCLEHAVYGRRLDFLQQFFAHLAKQTKENALLSSSPHRTTSPQRLRNPSPSRKVIGAPSSMAGNKNSLSPQRLKSHLKQSEEPSTGIKLDPIQRAVSSSRTPPPSLHSTSPQHSSIKASTTSTTPPREKPSSLSVASTKTEKKNKEEKLGLMMLTKGLVWKLILMAVERGFPEIFDFLLMKYCELFGGGDGSHSLKMTSKKGGGRIFSVEQADQIFGKLQTSNRSYGCLALLLSNDGQFWHPPPIISEQGGAIKDGIFVVPPISHLQPSSNMRRQMIDQILLAGGFRASCPLQHQQTSLQLFSHRRWWRLFFETTDEFESIAEQEIETGPHFPYNFSMLNYCLDSFLTPSFGESAALFSSLVTDLFLHEAVLPPTVLLEKRQQMPNDSPPSGSFFPLAPLHLWRLETASFKNLTTSEICAGVGGDRGAMEGVQVIGGESHGEADPQTTVEEDPTMTDEQIEEELLATRRRHENLDKEKKRAFEEIQKNTRKQYFAHQKDAQLFLTELSLLWELICKKLIVKMEDTTAPSQDTVHASTTVDESMRSPNDKSFSPRQKGVKNQACSFSFTRRSHYSPHFFQLLLKREGGEVGGVPRWFTVRHLVDFIPATLINAVAAANHSSNTTAVVSGSPGVDGSTSASGSFQSPHITPSQVSESTAIVSAPSFRKSLTLSQQTQLQRSKAKSFKILNSFRSQRSFAKKITVTAPQGGWESSSSLASSSPMVHHTSSGSRNVVEKIGTIRWQPFMDWKQIVKVLRDHHYRESISFPFPSTVEGKSGEVSGPKFKTVEKKGKTLNWKAQNLMSVCCAQKNSNANSMVGILSPPKNLSFTEDEVPQSISFSTAHHQHPVRPHHEVLTTLKYYQSLILGHIVYTQCHSSWKGAIVHHMDKGGEVKGNGFIVSEPQRRPETAEGKSTEGAEGGREKSWTCAECFARHVLAHNSYVAQFGPVLFLEYFLAMGDDVLATLFLRGMALLSRQGASSTISGEEKRRHQKQNKKKEKGQVNSCLFQRVEAFADELRYGVISPAEVRAQLRCPCNLGAHVLVAGHAGPKSKNVKTAVDAAIHAFQEHIKQPAENNELSTVIHEKSQSLPQRLPQTFQPLDLASLLITFPNIFFFLEHYLTELVFEHSDKLASAMVKNNCPLFALELVQLLVEMRDMATVSSYLQRIRSTLVDAMLVHGGASLHIGPMFLECLTRLPDVQRQLFTDMENRMQLCFVSPCLIYFLSKHYQRYRKEMQKNVLAIQLQMASNQQEGGGDIHQQRCPAQEEDTTALEVFSEHEITKLSSSGSSSPSEASLDEQQYEKHNTDKESGPMNLDQNEYEEEEEDGHQHDFIDFMKFWTHPESFYNNPKSIFLLDPRVFPQQEQIANKGAFCWSSGKLLRFTSISSEVLQSDESISSFHQMGTSQSFSPSTPPSFIPFPRLRWDSVYAIYNYLCTIWKEKSEYFLTHRNSFLTPTETEEEEVTRTASSQPKKRMVLVPLLCQLAAHAQASTINKLSTHIRQVISEEGEDSDEFQKQKEILNASHFTSVTSNFSVSSARFLLLPLLAVLPVVETPSFNPADEEKDLLENQRLLTSQGWVLQDCDILQQLQQLQEKFTTVTAVIMKKKKSSKSSSGSKSGARLLRNQKMFNDSEVICMDDDREGRKEEKIESKKSGEKKLVTENTKSMDNNNAAVVSRIYSSTCFFAIQRLIVEFTSSVECEDYPTIYHLTLPPSLLLYFEEGAKGYRQCLALKKENDARNKTRRVEAKGISPRERRGTQLPHRRETLLPASSSSHLTSSTHSSCIDPIGLPDDNDIMAAFLLDCMELFFKNMALRSTLEVLVVSDDTSPSLQLMRADHMRNVIYFENTQHWSDVVTCYNKLMNKKKNKKMDEKHPDEEGGEEGRHNENDPDVVKPSETACPSKEVICEMKKKIFESLEKYEMDFHIPNAMTFQCPIVRNDVESLEAFLNELNNNEDLCVPLVLQNALQQVSAFQKVLTLMSPQHAKKYYWGSHPVCIARSSKLSKKDHYQRKVHRNVYLECHINCASVFQFWKKYVQSLARESIEFLTDGYVTRCQATGQSQPEEDTAKTKNNDFLFEDTLPHLSSMGYENFQKLFASSEEHEVETKIEACEALCKLLHGLEKTVEERCNPVAGMGLVLLPSNQFTSTSTTNGGTNGQDGFFLQAMGKYAFSPEGKSKDGDDEKMNAITRQNVIVHVEVSIVKGGEPLFEVTCPSGSVSQVNNESGPLATDDGEAAIEEQLRQLLSSPLEKGEVEEEVHISAKIIIALQGLRFNPPKPSSPALSDFIEKVLFPTTPTATLDDAESANPPMIFEKECGNEEQREQERTGEGRNIPSSSDTSFLKCSSGGGQRPLVHLHIGGYGVAVGQMLWDIYGHQHQLNDKSSAFITTGGNDNEDIAAATRFLHENTEVLFQQNEKQHGGGYHPRCYFIDEELNVDQFEVNSKYMDIPKCRLFDLRRYGDRRKKDTAFYHSDLLLRSASSFSSRAAPPLPCHAGAYLYPSIFSSSSSSFDRNNDDDGTSEDNLSILLLLDQLLESLRRDNERSPYGMDIVLNYSVEGAFGCGFASQLAQEVERRNYAKNIDYLLQIPSVSSGKNSSSPLLNGYTSPLASVNACFGLAAIARQKLSRTAILTNLTGVQNHYAVSRQKRRRAAMGLSAFADPNHDQTLPCLLDLPYGTDLFPSSPTRTRSSELLENMLETCHSTVAMMYSTLTVPHRFGTQSGTKTLSSLHQSLCPFSSSSQKGCHSVFALPGFSLFSSDAEDDTSQGEDEEQVYVEVTDFSNSALVSHHHHHQRDEYGMRESTTNANDNDDEENEDDDESDEEEYMVISSYGQHSSRLGHRSSTEEGNTRGRRRSGKFCHRGITFSLCPGAPLSHYNNNNPNNSSSGMEPWTVSTTLLQSPPSLKKLLNSTVLQPVEFLLKKGLFTRWLMSSSGVLSPEAKECVVQQMDALREVIGEGKK